MKKFLFVVFVVSLFAGTAQANDTNIDIDVINSRMEIVNSTTIRFHNVSAASTFIPSGNYWADFQWDAVHYLFVPVNYGTEPPIDNECPPLPPPPPSGEFTLVFNAGTQSKMDCLVHGQTKYYMFTIPAGFTNFSMNVSLITQTANLDMVIAQSSTPISTAGLDAYLSDAVNFYIANPAYWGVPYYRNYPPSVWASINSGFGGEGVYLSSVTHDRYGHIIPIVKDSAGVAASIPGIYYVAVKNQSETVTATYYVYAKQ